MPTDPRAFLCRGRYRSFPSQAAPPKEYPFLAPPEAPDELGGLGHYAVLKVLGVGAMGVVFQAEDLHLKRMVRASKWSSRPWPRMPIHRSASCAKPSWPPPSSTITSSPSTRSARTAAYRSWPWSSSKANPWTTASNGWADSRLAEVLAIGREIAQGLAAAHARGLIHRDIKPANIWLEGDRNGRVKILDFGLARGHAEDDVHLTQAGAIVGTPAYMAPEQASAEEVDHRCDLFSLGRCFIG